MRRHAGATNNLPGGADDQRVDLRVREQPQIVEFDRGQRGALNRGAVPSMLLTNTQLSCEAPGTVDRRREGSLGTVWQSREMAIDAMSSNFCGALSGKTEQSISRCC